MTVGPGSTLAVNGNFSETSGEEIFNEQVGGTPASSQFGKTNITGSATLDGTFNLALVGGFTPSGGQSFSVMTFGSESGTFSTVTGLGTSFTQSLTPTALQLVSTLTNSTDLAAGNVTGPTTAIAGQPVTVTWQVTNNSSLPASGNWQDSVYLSSTPTITSNSLYLGAAVHNGGLAAGDKLYGHAYRCYPGRCPRQLLL